MKTKKNLSIIRVWVGVPVVVLVTGLFGSFLPSCAHAKSPQAQARPAYKTMKIQIVRQAKASLRKGTSTSVELGVEVADTEEKWQYGLMFQKTLIEGSGMLFIFANEEPRQFWMKNTFVDLAIGYFDAQKTLVSISEMKRATSEMQTDLPSYPSLRPAQFALEVPKGWFRRQKIQIGDKLVLP